MCAVSLARPSCPDNSAVSPGPGQSYSEHVGLVTDGETEGSGVWLFRSALKGRIFLPFAQRETGYRRDRTAQRGRSLVIPRVLVRMRTGKAPLWDHTLETGAGHCWPVCGRAIAPLMKPWCAEG